MTSPASYTFDEAFTALCIWEEITSPILADAGAPWEEMRDQVGVMELRERVLARLAAPCDQAWTRTYESHQTQWRVWNTRRNEMEAAGLPFFDDEPADPGCFDYDFVPFWLRNCVDWGDIELGPRVKGSGV